MGSKRKAVFLALLIIAVSLSCNTFSRLTGELSEPSATLSLTRTRVPTRTSTPIPSETSTPAGTPTSPPVPPLTQHQWHPQPVLISFGFFAGDGGVGGPPDFTLLGNGTLYVYQTGGLHKTELPREEVCRLLNTIDQAGFFAYDPSVINYDLMGDGAGGGFMEVNAWETQHFFLMELSLYVNGEIEDEGYYMPPVLPPIVDTYRLLDSYRPSSLQPSNDDKTVVFIRESSLQDTFGYEVMPWPESLFSLSTYHDNSGCVDVASRVLTTNEALAIRKLDTSWINSFFSEGDRIFHISFTTVLPFEQFPACVREMWPPSQLVVPDLPETISCSPEDGLVPIP